MSAAARCPVRRHHGEGTVPGDGCGQEDVSGAARRAFCAVGGLWAAAPLPAGNTGGCTAVGERMVSRVGPGGCGGEPQPLRTVLGRSLVCREWSVAGVTACGVTSTACLACFGLLARVGGEE